MVGSLFSSDAWNNITFASDEVIRPKRNLPLSLIYGTILVSIIYFLVNMAYVQALPVRGDAAGITATARGIQFATEDRVATAAMEGILGGNAAVVMALLVIISTFGCNNGIILASARVYYAMAVDGLFFKKIGILNSKGCSCKGTGHSKHLDLRVMPVRNLQQSARLCGISQFCCFIFLPSFLFSYSERNIPSRKGHTRPRVTRCCRQFILPPLPLS